ncbi:MAG: LPS export ABC transporter permease LptG [Deltaproteobacteria bacterium]|nr:LPS export ABC transporter permease LptG [Deltaproteobacteria bacterium]
MNKVFLFNILQGYIVRQFLNALVLCLAVSLSIFFVFDLFERINLFFKEYATFAQIASYMLFKIPLIAHLMTPVAVLIATLVSIGQLAQKSELTAMRACGVSMFRIALPLICIGALISAIMFISGETIVPWATNRVEEIYNFDIRKKAQTGKVSKANFWYRKDNKFYSIDFYDSRSATLQGVTIFEMTDNFALAGRIDAEEVVWKGPAMRWLMKNVVETSFNLEGRPNVSRFQTLPLVISEKPKDFYEIKLRPETMSYWELGNYIEKLQREGGAVSKYLVDLNAKLSFPLITVIVILVAFPFALLPARSGSLTKSFIAGISLGFGYYFVHAFSTSLGAAELIPAFPAAWTATILLGCLGGYLIAGADFA